MNVCESRHFTERKLDGLQQPYDDKTRTALEGRVGVDWVCQDLWNMKNFMMYEGAKRLDRITCVKYCME